MATDLFNEHGNVALGFHDWTLEQFYETFVHGFPHSPTRKNIATGFARFLLELIDVLGDFEIWTDGSFTTKKPDPNDIDTVTLIDGVDYMTQMSQEVRQKMFGKFEGPLTAEKYMVDSYLLVVYPQSHGFYQSYLRELNTRTRDFTFDDRTNLHKGIIKLHIDKSAIPLLRTWLSEGGEG